MWNNFKKVKDLAIDMMVKSFYLGIVWMIRDRIFIAVKRFLKFWALRTFRKEKNFNLPIPIALPFIFCYIKYN